MEEPVLNQVVSLPVDGIAPNPRQPRSTFSAESLCELAQSIAHNGLLQPITVREVGEGRYELIAGERRLRAFCLLGRAEIPAIVEQKDGAASRTLALVENLQREQLGYFEQAEAIRALMEEGGMTQSEAAQSLGLAQSTVANKLRLLRLDPRVREKICASGFTERHARCLLQLGDAASQLEAAAEIARREMNVAQAERYVERLLEERAPRQTRMFVPKDVRIFINTINKAVETMKSAGIEALTERGEDDAYICYTVRIPKLKPKIPAKRAN